MAFRPANPTAADYAEPFPSFIIDAIPGAAEKDEAVTAALKALRDAQRKAVSTREKLADLGGPGGPAPTAKRAAWDKADDAARAAAAESENATRAYARAAKARFEFVYDAMEEDPFTDQVEPLFAEASRRAKEHLDALQAALTERDDFASMLGRVIEKPGVWYGLDNALADVTAWVDAGLTDENADAWSYVNETLGNSLAFTSTKKAALDDCLAVDARDIPAHAKLREYKAIMAKHRIGTVIR